MLTQPAKARRTEAIGVISWRRQRWTLRNIQLETTIAGLAYDSNRSVLY